MLLLPGLFFWTFASAILMQIMQKCWGQTRLVMRWRSCTMCNGLCFHFSSDELGFVASVFWINYCASKYICTFLYVATWWSCHDHIWALLALAKLHINNILWCRLWQAVKELILIVSLHYIFFNLLYLSAYLSAVPSSLFAEKDKSKKTINVSIL